MITIPEKKCRSCQKMKPIALCFTAKSNECKECRKDRRPKKNKLVNKYRNPFRTFSLKDK